MPDNIWRARGNLFWINPFLRLIYMRVDFLKVVRMVFRSRFALTVALCAQKLDLWASLIWGWCPRVRSCPKNKHLAEKRRERANLKFLGQSLSQAGHYSPIFQQARKGFIYFMTSLTHWDRKKNKWWARVRMTQTSTMIGWILSYCYYY